MSLERAELAQLAQLGFTKTTKTHKQKLQKHTHNNNSQKYKHFSTRTTKPPTHMNYRTHSLPLSNYNTQILGHVLHYENQCVLMEVSLPGSVGSNPIQRYRTINPWTLESSRPCNQMFILVWMGLLCNHIPIVIGLLGLSMTQCVCVCERERERERERQRECMCTCACVCVRESACVSVHECVCVCGPVLRLTI